MATSSGTLSRAPRPSSLADVLDLILDKGLVVDAYVRVSVVGIELLTIDARVVVASVDTYLHFAEAVNRLDIVPDQKGLSSLFDENKNSSGKQGQDHEKRRRPLPSGGGGAPSAAAHDRQRGNQSEAEPARRQRLAERIAQRGRVEEEEE
jgi:hypothetical protein